MLNDARAGWISGITAYLLWGFAPLYWRLLREIPALPLLAVRVLFSGVLLLALLALLGRLQHMRRHLRIGTLATFAAAAMLLGTNWFVFLYAVLHDHVVEAALGYFINPLVNVALGTLVLAERPRRLQWVAIALASVGVLWFATAAGGVPWISLLLAGSFGLYGLVRKTASAGAIEGSALEMIFLWPVALVALVLLFAGTTSTANGLPPLAASGAWALLACSAAVTVSPLLLFAFAARRLPLSSIGFLQFTAPTCQFLLAVLVFGEGFDRDRLVAFAWIWVGLAIFLLDLQRASRRARRLVPLVQPTP